jgi:hypothetical protein
MIHFGGASHRCRERGSVHPALPTRPVLPIPRSTRC